MPIDVPPGILTKYMDMGFDPDIIKQAYEVCKGNDNEMIERMIGL